MAVEHINENDTLNAGRVKINAAIDQSNDAIEKATNAETSASQAMTVANEAKMQAQSTQAQLDQIVIEGDSSVEAAQARVGANGISYTTLKTRLDTEYNELSGQIVTLTSRLSSNEEKITSIFIQSNIYNKKEIIAHRGFEKIFPENTITAFSGAYALGADSVEFDIRPCADGTYVVMHDDTVDRTTDGTGSVSSMTLDQLKQLDAGIKFSQQFVGTKIPTFEEALDYCKDKFKTIYFEIKFTPTQSQINEIISIVENKNMIEQVSVESFDITWLQMVRQANSDVKICFVDNITSDKIDILSDLGNGMACSDKDYWFTTPTLVEECLAKNVAVAAWDVNRPHEYQSLVNIGITRVMSNRPY